MTSLDGAGQVLIMTLNQLVEAPGTALRGLLEWTGLAQHGAQNGSQHGAQLEAQHGADGTAPGATSEAAGGGGGALAEAAALLATHARLAVHAGRDVPTLAACMCASDGH